MKALFTFILLSATAVATAQTAVPFTFDDYLHIHTTISADGRPYTFQIDTGAGVDVISKTLATQLGTSPGPWHTGVQMTGTVHSGQLSRIKSLQLGPAEEQQPTVGIWPGLERNGYDGLLSAKAFLHAPVTFDFAKRQLVFETEKSLAKIERDTTAVPLLFHDDRGQTLDLFAEFDFGNGQRGLCEVDTGSPGIKLSTRYMEALGIDPSSANIRKQENGKEVLYFTKLPRVSLAAAPGFAADDADVIFWNTLIYDCVVGNKFWQGRSFTLDLPHRELRVKEEPAGRVQHSTP